MADVYARDAAARDLRLLDSLIREVRSGAFKPDEANEASRDLRNEAEPDKGRMGFAEDLGEEADGYVTTDSSESDTDEDERELVQRHFYPPVAPAHHTFVQHQKSKLLHYLKDGNIRVLVCGRTKSSAYVNPGALRYDSAVCHACQMAVNRE